MDILRTKLTLQFFLIPSKSPPPPPGSGNLGLGELKKRVRYPSKPPSNFSPSPLKKHPKPYSFHSLPPLSSPPFHPNKLKQILK